MENTTSVGPDSPRPEDKHEGRATIEGVDAQNASANDLKQGIAGAEAKPFSPATAEPPKADRSTDACDSADKAPREAGLVSERRTAGRDDRVDNAAADASGSER
ncbi:hypothetical protein [Novosphingobium kaempferiae]|uniref:hypothetical protein n=1 Tax=Novosphingobium kaempferiae TaxID=2896849 RepID=UPI001E4EAE84|nr:hypothetical protein [Novosphingobium kaempferiae]